MFCVLLQAEEDLYYKSGQLVRFLTEWKGCAPHLPGRVEELIIELYERQYVEVEDVLLTQQWLRALAAAQYAFPGLITPQLTHNTGR